MDNTEILKLIANLLIATGVFILIYGLYVYLKPNPLQPITNYKTKIVMSELKAIANNSDFDPAKPGIYFITVRTPSIEAGMQIVGEEINNVKFETGKLLQIITQQEIEFSKLTGQPTVSYFICAVMAMPGAQS